MRLRKSLILAAFIAHRIGDGLLTALVIESREGAAYSSLCGRPRSN
jgi:hypothetical protein